MLSNLEDNRYIMPLAIFTIAILSFIFTSCNKKESRFNITSQHPCQNKPITYKSVKIPSNIDLSTENLNIEILLNESSEWQITIKGKSSNATKIFKGSGELINFSWNGLSDSLPLFTNESIELLVQGPCLKDLRQTISLKVSNNYSNLDYFIYDGDFKTTPILAYPPSGGSFNSGTIDPTIQNIDYSPQKGKVYFIESTSPSPIIFQGGCYHNVVIPYTDPSSIYFNGLFHFMNASDFNIIINIDDLSGSHTYEVTPPSNNSQWKYVSFSLASIGVSNPQTVININYSIKANKNPISNAKMMFDFISLSNIKPVFKPNQTTITTHPFFSTFVTNNNYFKVDNIENKSYLLKIYDFEGNKVLETNQYLNNWPQGKTANGTYYYIYQTPNEEFKGSFIYQN